MRGANINPIVLILHQRLPVIIVRAWHKTYDMPVITTNCSNNFGPWQHPEKLIPSTIIKALTNTKIPIYGNGKNIRVGCTLKIMLMLF